MKTLFCLFILSAIVGYNKVEDLDPLDPSEKDFLISRVSVFDVHFIEGVADKLKTLNSLSILYSTGTNARETTKLFNL